jgi:hypothetical protein
VHLDNLWQQFQEGDSFARGYAELARALNCVCGNRRGTAQEARGILPLVDLARKQKERIGKGQVKVASPILVAFAV